MCNIIQGLNYVFGLFVVVRRQFSHIAYTHRTDICGMICEKPISEYLWQDSGQLV